MQGKKQGSKEWKEGRVDGLGGGVTRWLDMRRAPAGESSVSCACECVSACVSVRVHYACRRLSSGEKPGVTQSMR